jgi:general stress protein 26
VKSGYEIPSLYYRRVSRNNWSQKAVATTTQEIEHLAKLISGIRIAMMTTVCKGGSLRSRPMATQGPPFDGGLWFFIQANSSKVGEVTEEGQVNVTYENAQESVYVSLSGQATLVQDRQQIEKLWHDDLRIWFPKGVHDPQLALLRIDVDRWSYWDGRTNDLSEHRGRLGDAPAEVIPDLGDHRRVDLSGVWVSQDVGTSKTRNEIPLNGL